VKCKRNGRMYSLLCLRADPPHTNICHKPAAQGNEWRVLLFLAEAFVIVRGIGGVMRVIPPQLSDDVHHNECLVSHVSGAISQVPSRFRSRQPELLASHSRNACIQKKTYPTDKKAERTMRRCRCRCCCRIVAQAGILSAEFFRLVPEEALRAWFSPLWPKRRIILASCLEIILFLCRFQRFASSRTSMGFDRTITITCQLKFGGRPDS
jgi:hypothetical protein